MFIRFFLLGSTIFLCSCASPGTYTMSYVQPHSYYIRNEKHVNTAPDDVWNKLVKEISKSFFVINNIDKESRIINLSFYTENSEKYVDCGNTIINTVITIPPPKNIHKEYKYNNSEDTYLVIGHKSKDAFGMEIPSVIKIDRKTELNGRMNIYVAPSIDGTLVTVNCRYIFRVDENKYVTGYNITGKPLFHEDRKLSNTCTFDTKRPGNCTLGTGYDKSEFRCISMGRLEGKILSFIEK